MKKILHFLFLNSAPKKIGITLCFTFCILHCASCFAQNPLVKIWDKRFGGNFEDDLLTMQRTREGGFILGGLSNSANTGDKTQNTVGLWDYWIVKTDSVGVKQWDKDFGGTNADMLYSVIQTNDGGYLLGGTSKSGIGGDKTQDTVGSNDYWIVKIDSLGIKEWDKDFGGTSDDELTSVLQTSDGGYFLSGISYSGIGGDKSSPSVGGYDYWIIKVDSLGIKQWDKTIGGTSSEEIYCAELTRDGGYILGGFSYSGIGGDKTEDNWGGYDYWIVKLDSLGGIQWDKDFGGIDQEKLFYLFQTKDMGYLLSGCSLSGISGDKTQDTWGQYDVWVIKIDSVGNKIWDRDYGGTQSDGTEFSKTLETNDGGYLIGADSYSINIGGDKTEPNLGYEQTWLLKIDSVGNKKWDKTIFEAGHCDFALLASMEDDCFLVANTTEGGIAGYCTQNSRGGFDFWIAKFCETPQANFTSSPFICPGTCVEFTNLSFLATSYQWNFYGASPDTSTAINPQSICYATPGSYDVQLIATNANGSDTLLLPNYFTVYPTPPPQSITQNGDTLFAIAGAASYQWYYNSNIINGATNYFYLAQASGDYNVVATDTNGCEVEAAIFNVTAGLTPALSKGEGVIVFPNPVVDKITIQNSVPMSMWATNGTTVEISVYNMLGENIDCAFDRRQLTVDCRLLPSGMYWLEIYDGKRIFRSKFVKQ